MQSHIDCCLFVKLVKLLDKEEEEEEDDDNINQQLIEDDACLLLFRLSILRKQTKFGCAINCLFVILNLHLSSE